MSEKSPRTARREMLVDESSETERRLHRVQHAAERKRRVPLYAADVAEGRAIRYVVGGRREDLPATPVAQERFRGATPKKFTPADMTLIAKFQNAWRRLDSMPDMTLRFGLALVASINDEIQRPELLGRIRRHRSWRLP